MAKVKGGEQGETGWGNLLAARQLPATWLQLSGGCASHTCVSVLPLYNLMDMSGRSAAAGA